MEQVPPAPTSAPTPSSLGMGFSSAGHQTDGPSVYLDTSAVEATWLERLILNLLSYSLVLVPIAVIVLAVRYRLLPACLQSSTLIQLFVNGGGFSSRDTGQLDDSPVGANSPLVDRESLIIEDRETANKKANHRMRSHHQDPPDGQVLKFLWCFAGLMTSYLVWGILQEKIMTTKYLTDNSTAYESKVMIDTTKSTHKNNVITFHDSQFLVFINRIIAFILALMALIYDRPKRSASQSRLLYLSNGKYQVQYRSHPNQSRGAGSQSSVATKPSAPLYQFVYCSLSNILSSWCQYEALKYVNFPTQVLSKTFKIVPVMIMSKILLHKRYKPTDYACALALSLGMFIFLVNQPVSSPLRHHSSTNQVEDGSAKLPATTNHSDTQDLAKRAVGSRDFGPTMALSGSTALLSGLLLLSLYLAFDSFTGNWQKSLFTRYQVTNWQMMAAVNLYSILLTLTSLFQLGNLAPALKLLASSRQLLCDCLLMSVMSSVGQFFVYYTINQFGPVIFTVIMTFRQLVAILLSCALYGHQVTLGSSLGILLVFLVVGFQLWHRSSSSGSNKTAATLAKSPSFAALGESSRLKSTGGGGAFNR